MVQELLTESKNLDPVPSTVLPKLGRTCRFWAFVWENEPKNKNSKIHLRGSRSPNFDFGLFVDILAFFGENLEKIVKFHWKRPKNPQKMSKSKIGLLDLADFQISRSKTWGDIFLVIFHFSIFDFSANFSYVYKSSKSAHTLIICYKKLNYHRALKVS